MSSNQELKALAEAYCMGNYGERKIALVRGQGAYVWDADGKKYVDCLAGIAVNNTGHCHPRVVKAIQEQAATLIHVSNLYLIEPQIRLAEYLCKNTFAAKAFFCNSGAEAIEGALKLARKYAKDKGYEHRSGYITMLNSFHGRTFGTVSATGQEKIRKGFDPLLPNFKYVPLNDLEAVRSAVDEETCAILVEPVQGEGGVRVADEAFLHGLREICDQRDMLLLYDEVQTGNGRTGKLFAYMHSGVVPDALSTAKGLGGGMPIGALLVSEKCQNTLSPGTHASTFGGNALASAAALASLQVIEDEGLCQKAWELGLALRTKLQSLQRRVKGIMEVRGLGLLIGVEMESSVTPVLAEMAERGFLLGSAGPNVIRVAPPLVISEEDLQRMLDNLEEVLVK